MDEERRLTDEIAGCLESLEEREGGWSASFHFQAGLSVFAGHFPGAPMVPAVHLVEAARLTLERGLGEPLALLEIREGRFTASVGPGDRVELDAQVLEQGDAGELAARVRVLRGGEAAAQLRLRLGRRAER